MWPRTQYRVRDVALVDLCKRNVKIVQEIKARVNGEKGVRRFELALLLNHDK